MKHSDSKEIMNLLEIQKIVYMYESYLNMFFISSMLEHARNFTEQQGGVVFGAVSLDGPKNKAKNFIVKIDSKYANMIYDIKGIECRKEKDFIYFIVPFLKLGIKDFISFWNYNALSRFSDNTKDARIINVDFYGTNIAKISGGFSSFILYNERDFVKRNVESKVRKFVKDKIENFVASSYGLPILIGKQNNARKRNDIRKLNFFYEKLNKYYIKVIGNDYIFPTIESLGFSYVFSKDNEVLQKSLSDIFINIYNLGHYVRVPLFYNILLYDESLNSLLNIVKDKIGNSSLIKGKDTIYFLEETFVNFIYSLVFTFDSIISLEDLERILAVEELGISFLNTFAMPIEQTEYVKAIKEQARNLMSKYAELVRAHIDDDTLRSFIDSIKEKKDYSAIKEKLLNNISFLENDYKKAIEKPPLDFFKNYNKKIDMSILESIVFIIINTKDYDELSQILMKL